MGISPVVLYNSVYDDVSAYVTGPYDPVPYPGCTYKQYASTYLLHSVVRKWIPDDSREADRNAIDAFTSANNRCRVWKYTPRTEVDVMVLGEIRRILDDFFHPFGMPLISSYFELLAFGRPGPGVNVGAKGTSYYTKYLASPLTSTSPYLYEEYRRYCEWIPFLSEAECLRYDEYGPPSIVKGSRSSLVPKTAATSRMICIEPSVNMYYQLGLAYHLEERLKSYFRIDLSSQPLVNHRLARLGSIDGSYATIDLSSASDSISLALCELILPKWFFELLLTLRSHTTEIDKKRVPLYMMSTMGNGFTFPLQTIIFAAITAACNSVLGITGSESFSVFGDDIICKAKCFPLLSHTLKLMGFTLNSSKTFFEGPFRESCGADWFSGQPVRPVFIKKLDTPFDTLVAINQLNDWSAYTGIPLKNTVALLYNSLGRKFRTYVPFEAAQDAGIRVPLAFINPRYDRNLSFLYKSWARRPSKLKILEGYIHVPRGFRGKLFYNPPGLYSSFLFGELVSGEIMIRHNLKSYRSRLVCSPRWDYIPTDSLTNGVRLSWQRWETAVRQNLNPL